MANLPDSPLAEREAMFLIERTGARREIRQRDARVCLALGIEMLDCTAQPLGMSPQHLGPRPKHRLVGVCDGRVGSQIREHDGRKMVRVPSGRGDWQGRDHVLCRAIGCAAAHQNGQNKQYNPTAEPRIAHNPYPHDNTPIHHLCNCCMTLAAETTAASLRAVSSGEYCISLINADIIPCAKD